MRKTTMFLVAILLLAAGSMAWMLGWVTDLIRPELDASAEWSRQYAPDLAPGAKVKVSRHAGGPDMPLGDSAQRGLLVDVRLSDATWSKSGAAAGIGLSIASQAFERYAADRPLAWTRVRLLRADGSVGAELAFTWDEVGRLTPIPVRPGASPPSPAAAPPAPAGTPPPADPVRRAPSIR